jgi:hypothetical protein
VSFLLVYFIKHIGFTRGNIDSVEVKVDDKRPGQSSKALKKLTFTAELAVVNPDSSGVILV